MIQLDSTNAWTGESTAPQVTHMCQPNTTLFVAVGYVDASESKISSISLEDGTQLQRVGFVDQPLAFDVFFLPVVNDSVLRISATASEAITGGMVSMTFAGVDKDQPFADAADAGAFFLTMAATAQVENPMQMAAGQASLFDLVSDNVRMQSLSGDPGADNLNPAWSAQTFKLRPQPIA